MQAKSEVPGGEGKEGEGIAESDHKWGWGVQATVLWEAKAELRDHQNSEQGEGESE